MLKVNKYKFALCGVACLIENDYTCINWSGMTEHNWLFGVAYLSVIFFLLLVQWKEKESVCEKGP